MRYLKVNKVKCICLIIMIFIIVFIKGEFFLYTSSPKLLWTRYSVEDIQQKVDFAIVEMIGDSLDSKNKLALIPQGMYDNIDILNRLKGVQLYAYCDYLISKGKNSIQYKWYKMTYQLTKGRILVAYDQLMEIERTLKDDEDPKIKMLVYQQSFWCAGWRYLHGDDLVGPLAIRLGHQVIDYLGKENPTIWTEKYSSQLLLIQLFQATDKEKKQLLSEYKFINSNYFLNLYKGVFYADMREYELATNCLSKGDAVNYNLLKQYIFFSQNEDIVLNKDTPLYPSEFEEEQVYNEYSNRCSELYLREGRKYSRTTDSKQIGSMIYYYVYGRYYESIGDDEKAKESYTQMFFQGLQVLRFPKMKQKLEEYGILETYEKDIRKAKKDFLDKYSNYAWIMLGGWISNIPPLFTPIYIIYLPHPTLRQW